MNLKKNIVLLLLIHWFQTFICLPPICISLGGNCIPAYHLRSFGLREYAFPFDWSLSFDINSFIKAFDSDFKDFFSCENLIHVEAHHIKDTLYNITYLHDFPFHMIDVQGSPYPEIDKDWKAYCKKIKEKYDRRIMRLIDLRNSKRLLIFFRYFYTNKAAAVMLKDHLIKFFYPAEIELIVINNTEEFKIDWQIPQIKNYYFPGKIDEAWNPQHFVTICKELNLALHASINNEVADD